MQGNENDDGKNTPEESNAAGVREEGGGAATEPPSGKEAYEVCKREREAAKTQKIKQQPRPKRNYTKGVVWALVALVILAGLVFFITQTGPKGEDFSRAIPDFGRQHIPVGSPRPEYNSNPPTSGPHYPTPAAPGFREEPIVDEYIIHSLEHGIVWVSYHPRVGEDVKNALRKFARSAVIVTERAANDSDIALASWGRLDTFDLEDGTLDKDDRERIGDFIKRYRNRGLETIPAGRHGGI